MRFVPGVDADQELSVVHNRPHLEFVKDIVGGAELLNVGCWTGAFEALAVGEAKRTVGIDIEPGALDVARSNVPGVEFVQASVLDLPFDDGSFDMVTMWAVIEHIPLGTESRALEESARVLKPGGLLALSTPSDQLLSKLLDPAFFVAGHRHYGRERLAGLLERAGLRVERMEVLGGWVVALDSFAFYFWKYLMRRPMTPGSRMTEAYLRDASREGFNVLFALARRP